AIVHPRNQVHSGEVGMIVWIRGAVIVAILRVRVLDLDFPSCGNRSINLVYLVKGVRGNELRNRNCPRIWHAGWDSTIDVDRVQRVRVVLSRYERIKELFASAERTMHVENRPFRGVRAGGEEFRRSELAEF